MPWEVNIGKISWANWKFFEGAINRKWEEIMRDYILPFLEHYILPFLEHTFRCFETILCPFGRLSKLHSGDIRTVQLILKKLFYLNWYSYFLSIFYPNFLMSNSIMLACWAHGVKDLKDQQEVHMCKSKVYECCNRL